ncbi:glycosyltransferase family 4 protein [Sporosarcina sp. ACRSL]|uniref:glycosyltransferase family 4 protein n=1 Tax=Sporosarcina sp. ACRSL TaxID=2918215 RepID=UPI001EF63FFC|nr:glycosyltransferase family 4 protein [Sporosarcina sp. ACRSL]MCG7343991.1 glycosyltransferase family 4 protein [Sporosarcina sp. ACRSL]
MNIWIFNHYAKTPLQNAGTRHYELAKYLISKGCKVTIIASSYSNIQKKYVIDHEKENYKVENVEGIRFVWLKTTPYQKNSTRILSFFSYYNQSIKTVKKAFANEEVDVIIGSSVHPLAALAAYKISKQKNSKFYFEERDLWPQTFIDFGKISETHVVSRMLYGLEKFLYKKSDKIIVLFDRAVGYVKSKGINEDKVFHIPNGVNINSFKLRNESEIVDKMLREFEGKFKIIYTGSHGIANDLDKLIDLAEQVKLSDPEKNIHFLSVGAGPLKNELICKAAEKKLDNITFLDPIRKVDIPYLLSKADMSYISILDSPLYKWGFSMNKLYDYLAAGLPMIMHTNPKLVGEFNDLEGVFVSENSKMLCDKILWLYNHQDQVPGYSAALKNHVESRYSWSILGEKIYKEMISDMKPDDIEVSNQKLEVK